MSFIQVTNHLAINKVSSGSKKKGKEVLSKAAKRRQSDRLSKYHPLPLHLMDIYQFTFCIDNQGELPRGWNWVDIIKHVGVAFPLMIILS